jgi:hypothetical protein
MERAAWPSPGQSAASPRQRPDGAIIRVPRSLAAWDERAVEPDISAVVGPAGFVGAPRRFRRAFNRRIGAKITARRISYHYGTGLSRNRARLRCASQQMYD